MINTGENIACQQPFLCDNFNLSDVLNLDIVHQWSSLKDRKLAVMALAFYLSMRHMRVERHLKALVSSFNSDFIGRH